MDNTQINAVHNNYIKKKGLTIIRSVLVLILVMLLLNVITLPFYIIGDIVRSEGGQSIAPFIETIGEITAYIIIIRVLIKKPRLREGFRFKIKNKPTILGLVFSVVIILGYILISGNTIHILLSHLEVSEWVTEAFDEMFKYPILAIFGTCVIAPVFEETIFRGIILERLSHRYSKITALVVSSLLFAVFHLNIHQGVNAFFLALIIGGVYLATQSLYMSMFVHFVNNAFATLPAIWMSSDMTSNVEQNSPIQFDMGQLIVGIILLLISIKVFQVLSINSNNKITNEYVVNSRSEDI